ncbi:MAG: protein BatD [Magnetococcales bacterium]|nr:protein BatD [Magnetococcales bacterium]
MVTPRTRGVARRVGVLLLCLLFTASAGEAAFQVKTDRQPIYEEESFRLLFETDAELSGTPDFSVLEQDFEVLGKQQGSSFQSINGRHSQKSTWTVTLLPRRAGSFTIPAIAFGAEKSPEYTVTIRQGSAPSSKKADKQGEDLFLEVSASPEKVYVQSQVIYTVRFFRSVEITGASLTEPQLSATDAVVEKLGDDRTFETTLHGVQYLVVERRYALYPQRSGQLTIAPLRLEAQVGKRGLFGLLDDPFSAGGGSVKRRHSTAVQLEVMPIPDSFQGPAWLPAHRLQLMEKWSENPPKFQVGEAITRTLTLLADGLTSAQLPEISDMGQQNSSQRPPIKLYPDQPVLTDQREPTGIIGMRQEKVAMVPFQPGSFVLPAIQIVWWNMDTQSREVASLPERTITVIPSATTVTPPAQSMAAPRSVPQTTSPAKGLPVQESVSETNVTETKTANATLQGEKKAGVGAVEVVAAYPRWLTHLLAGGWLLTLLLGWLWPRLTRLRRRPVAGDLSSRPPELDKALALLQASCTQNSPDKCRVALLSWAQACWPEQILQNLNDLQRLLNQLQFVDLAQEIVRLDHALFSPKSPVPWSGAGLWEAVLALPKSAAKQPRMVVPPLYQ